MNRRVRFILAAAFVLALAGNTFAQNDARPGPRSDGRTRHERPRHMMGPEGMGKWWTNSQVVQKLGISDIQVQQIDKIFQDHRLQLIDLRANLQKQEATLRPLVEADHPNEGQISEQIDKVAQARSELEKNHARMFLAIRQVLTLDQWKSLQAQRGMGMMAGPRGGPPDGPPGPKQ